MRILRIALLVLLTLTPLVLQAQEPYFCTEGSRTLYYERYKAGARKLFQTTTLEIGKAERSGKGRNVHYGMLLRKAGGREMMGGTAQLTAQIEGNGDVWMDFGSMVKVVLQNMFPRAKITQKGDPAIMPAKMQPEDTLPDAHCVVRLMGFNVTVDVTERRVLRCEKLTTPAGTFNCMVVREHKVEDGPMHHNDLWSDTWYAPGVGYVRRDGYDKKMRMEYTEVLIRDEKSEP